MKIHRGTYIDMISKWHDQKSNDIYIDEKNNWYYWSDTTYWMQLPTPLKERFKDKIQKQIRLDKLDELGI